MRKFKTQTSKKLVIASLREGKGEGAKQSPDKKQVLNNEGIASPPIHNPSLARNDSNFEELGLPTVYNESAELYEIKADRQPVGYYDGKEEHPFTNHNIQLQKGDVIYIFSDGYADQLGGDRCKKFGYNRFRQLLTDISDKNMEEQKQILDVTIEAWKDHIDPYNNKLLEQMDDILVMGMRF
ncbi:MAG: SpoIIE family protein phosphatase [Bacteroidetes bacterium]|nr:SpoIIE family protein phosphatase [Bacteroidota bacterium]